MKPVCEESEEASLRPRQRRRLSTLDNLRNNEFNYVKITCAKLVRHVPCCCLVLEVLVRREIVGKYSRIEGVFGLPIEYEWIINLMAVDEVIFFITLVLFERRF